LYDTRTIEYRCEYIRTVHTLFGRNWEFPLLVNLTQILSEHPMQLKKAHPFLFQIAGQRTDENFRYRTSMIIFRYSLIVLKYLQMISYDTATGQNPFSGCKRPRKIHDLNLPAFLLLCTRYSVAEIEKGSRSCM
jgi:hypothetical protein